MQVSMREDSETNIIVLNTALKYKYRELRKNTNISNILNTNRYLKNANILNTNTY